MLTSSKWFNRRSKPRRKNRPFSNASTPTRSIKRSAASCITKGYLYRELQARLELLGQAYGKTKAESAQAHLVTYADQFTTNPKPLAELKLRSDVRRYCWQLLGPPPEAEEAFYTNADGTPCGCPRPQREEPKPEEPKKKAPRQEKQKA